MFFNKMPTANYDSSVVTQRMKGRALYAFKKNNPTKATQVPSNGNGSSGEVVLDTIQGACVCVIGGGNSTVIDSKTAPGNCGCN
jgi:hypothetical protein